MFAIYLWSADDVMLIAGVALVFCERRLENRIRALLREPARGAREVRTRDSNVL